MINTINTKEQQLRNGYFKIGGGNTVILIVGSCRCVQYINYFMALNTINQYTILFIDPYNFCYDLQDNRVDFETAILALEKDERILSMLPTVDLYIHEYYQHFGMFNSSKEAEKNIYQFGLAPLKDICLPNFNNFFILFSDIVTFNPEIRKQCIADFNVLGKLSYQTELELFKISNENIEKFYEVCRKSDIPEMEQYFKENYKSRRLWVSYNHVGNPFSNFVMDKIISQLKIYIPHETVYQMANLPDLFDNNYSPLTEYDVKWHEYKWNEPIIELKTKL